MHELADSAIAATELDDQLPSQRIAEQPEDRGRLRRSHTQASFDGGGHSLTVHQAYSMHQVHSMYGLAPRTQSSPPAARQLLARSVGMLCGFDAPTTADHDG